MLTQNKIKRPARPSKLSRPNQPPRKKRQLVFYLLLQPATICQVGTQKKLGTTPVLYSTYQLSLRNHVNDTDQWFSGFSVGQASTGNRRRKSTTTCNTLCISPCKIKLNTSIAFNIEHQRYYSADCVSLDTFSGV